MSRDSVLAAGRRAAEAGMVDACTIRRVTGKTTNSVTGVVTKTHATLYTGKCRVQQQRALAEQRDVAEDRVLLLRLEVQLPVSATGLRTSDEITITASRDADLVGRVLLIRDLAHKTDATSRRVQVTERTG